MENFIDDACKDAIGGYLRTCSNGGMPDKEVDLVRNHCEAMADLNYFSVMVLTAMKEKGMKLVKVEDDE